MNYKKLNKNARTPTQGSTEAAGYDLYAALDEPVTIEPGTTKFIGTGLAMEVPKGYGAFIYARSGMACKQDLAPANKVGVIDSDYRGEFIVALHNHGSVPRTVNNGDRIAQMVIAPYLTVEFNEVDELDNTSRGAGGFGSSGKN